MMITSPPCRLNTSVSLNGWQDQGPCSSDSSLLDPPILFAHRGARAHAPENTLEAFSLALRLEAGASRVMSG